MPILHAAEIQRLLENVDNSIFVWELLYCFGNLLKHVIYPFMKHAKKSEVPVCVWELLHCFFNFFSLTLFILHETCQEIGNLFYGRLEGNQIRIYRNSDSYENIPRTDGEFISSNRIVVQTFLWELSSNFCLKSGQDI